MRKSLVWMTLVLSLLLLSACSLTGPSNGGPGEGVSDAQAGTQVADLLTQMAPTGQLVTETATAALPTVAVGGEAAGPTQAVEASATATPLPPTPLPPTDLPLIQPSPTPTVQATETVAPSATVEPTAAVTLTPVATITQTAAPVLTPPPGDPRLRLGSPTSTDLMDDGYTWVWPTGSDNYTSGSFSGGSMALTARTDTDGWRMANSTGREVDNLYLEATVRTGTCSGSDHYGLIVRVPDPHAPDQGYLFSFTCDGRYSLRRWNGKAGEKGETVWLVDWRATNAIVAGSNQVNRISMFASGNRLILYANGSPLTEVKDTTYANGYFGVLIGSDETENLTLYVEEMSYWENPQP